jgi:hypothetical protein
MGYCIRLVARLVGWISPDLDSLACAAAIDTQVDSRSIHIVGHAGVAFFFACGVWSGVVVTVQRHNRKIMEMAPKLGSRTSAEVPRSEISSICVYLDTQMYSAVQYLHIYFKSFASENDHCL